uniref:MD-2-related lipid-recognition domain-containing protein n=1 Tax=Amphimedon queenslandica TaxID=400682 RepID=A0A1X7U426_AMPQE
MSVLLLIILTVIPSLPTSTGSTNNYYNAITHDFVIITNLSFNTTIKRGQSYGVQGVINLKKEIKWGIMHAKITHQFKNYVNLTFEDANYNLCDISVSVTGKYCPLKPGIYHGIYKDTIPSVLWPGKYIFKIHGYNEDNVELFCAMTEVNVEK